MNTNTYLRVFTFCLAFAAGMLWAYYKHRKPNDWPFLAYVVVAVIACFLWPLTLLQAMFILGRITVELVIKNDL